MSPVWSQLLQLFSFETCGPGAASGAGAPEIAPTPRATVPLEGTSVLYRFRPAAPDGTSSHAGADGARRPRLPLLLVPSLINRWYVLDLRRGASLIEALVAAGIDTWCLDWGAPEDEDRYLSWDAVMARLARAARRVLRRTGAPRLGLLGYCMGGTMSAIHAALHPDRTAALINLAGPIDFSRGGKLRRLVDGAWFDPDAIADAGNVTGVQMQSGFAALRPTLELAKAVRLADTGRDPAAREAFAALEAWSRDNTPFPADTYRRYIRELYQGNQLIQGAFRVAGRQVELGAIECPVMTVVADRDEICPPASALALNAAVSSRDTSELSVPGGHVGAVVGARASRQMYPATAKWLRHHLA